MFLHPFPNRSPVDIPLVKTKTLVLIELSGQTLRHRFVNTSWCSLVHLSSKERVEGLSDWIKPSRQCSKPELKAPASALKQLLSEESGRASELQNGGNGVCSPRGVTSRAARGPRDAWQHAVPGCPSCSVNEGMRRLSSTVGFVGAHLAPRRFIWILGERK